MVTLSLNLTAQEYRGGALQFRYRGSEQILHEVRNTGLGDALLLRVSKKLFHRVLPVEGDVPRTVLAGWFRWEKGNVNFHDALRNASQVNREESDYRNGAGHVGRDAALAHVSRFVLPHFSVVSCAMTPSFSWISSCALPCIRSRLSAHV
jgi:hypothetical protein